MVTQRTRLTAEDLAALPVDGPDYELIAGELVEMTPPGPDHGYVQAKLTTRLFSFVETHDLGVVLTETGVPMSRDPDTVRAPDVCFIARDRIPAVGLGRPYLTVIPDLVAEIISPSDRAGEVNAKIEAWIAAGAPLVWALYPDTRTIFAHHGRDSVRVFRSGDTLEAEPVLPGFRIPVDAIFER